MSSPGGAAIFFFTVFTSVDLPLFIGQQEDLIESLLDGCDAARIFAGDDVFYLLWQMQLHLRDDRVVLDDIDGDIVIDKA